MGERGGGGGIFLSGRPSLPIFANQSAQFYANFLPFVVRQQGKPRQTLGPGLVCDKLKTRKVLRVLRENAKEKLTTKEKSSVRNKVVARRRANVCRRGKRILQILENIRFRLRNLIENTKGSNDVFVCLWKRPKVSLTTESYTDGPHRLGRLGILCGNHILSSSQLCWDRGLVLDEQTCTKTVEIRAQEEVGRDLCKTGMRSHGEKESSECQSLSNEEKVFTIRLSSVY